MEEEISYIGNARVWGGEKPFGISPAERRQHLYVIGQTGTGKTTLLRNLIVQDIACGRGVGLIDPHGDLSEEILNCIPSWRTDDVLYFSPGDAEFPVGFNLLFPLNRERKYLEASAVVGAFKHLWRDSWGPRLEYILYASIAALMECDDVSLLGIPRMLVDETYRWWVVRQIRDPIVRFFWENEFAKFDKRLMAEIVSPLQNKVGQLLMAAPLRNVFGQVKNKIDPRSLMDKKHIFIANLSKGKLGEDKANLLGSFLVSAFHTAAMGRSDIPEGDRIDFSLYIDEFQNFSTDSFANVLSEARKYRLNLTLAGQYISQMEAEVREAVFGNVGSVVSFRVGAEDAHLLSRQFGRELTPEQFTDLGNHEIRAKILKGGQFSEPLFGRTMAPFPYFHGHRGNLMNQSRARFGTPREKVEGKINRWFER